MSHHNNQYGIFLEGKISPPSSGNITIFGKYRVPYGKDGVPTESLQVLKHIVLVATRSDNYQALTPFKEVVVFEDDVKDEGSCCSGLFNIQLMDHIAFKDEGDYYILCSIGTYISNVVHITIV